MLPGFRSADAVAALRQRAQAIVEAFEPRGKAACSPPATRRAPPTPYFLASADRIHCFFEEEAFGEDGRLRRTKALSINKIGHALHDLDPVFDRFSHGADLAALAADLGLAQPQVWQSMLIFKQPRIGGEVGWHQDASFFVTEPLSVTTFWFALEDATLDNGCLWVEPGGHRGPLRERFVREGERCAWSRWTPRPGPTARGRCRWKWMPARWCAFTGCCRTGARPTARPSRQAYTLHVTDARCAWSPLELAAAPRRSAGARVSLTRAEGSRRAKVDQPKVEQHTRWWHERRPWPCRGAMLRP